MALTAGLITQLNTVIYLVNIVHAISIVVGVANPGVRLANYLHISIAQRTKTLISFS